MNSTKSRRQLFARLTSKRKMQSSSAISTQDENALGRPAAQSNEYAPTSDSAIQKNKGGVPTCRDLVARNEQDDAAATNTRTFTSNEASIWRSRGSSLGSLDSREPSLATEKSIYVERRNAQARPATRRRSSGGETFGRSGSLEIKQAALEELQRCDVRFNENDPNLPREWTGGNKNQYIVGPTDNDGTIATYWHRLAVRTSTVDTPPNELVRRGAFMLMSSLTCGAGLVWASLYYFILNEPLAASFPTIYSVLMTLCFAFMTKKGQYENIVFTQLLLILVLPICLQLSVGGIVKGGCVQIWSFLCPLGAALFCHHSTAKRWFAVYFVTMVCTLLVEMGNEASEDGPIFDPNDVAILGLQEIGLFVMNIGGALAITFFGALAFSIRLEEEFHRSEDLLLNILPKSIAKRLKKGEIHIVENIDAVSILFADLVGFTKASAELHPNFLIGMVLRDVFSAWDELSQRRSIEKIKTIGDAYMCVGGLDDSDDNGKGVDRRGRIVAYEMVMLGLEMKRALDAVNERYGTRFQVRIGIHSGPCIAGVIGVKRFAFDIWGDAVNTASRMESHGVPGQIHISSETYDNIKHLSYLQFDCQGDINVKGKGTMKTYLVTLREAEQRRRLSISRLGYESYTTFDNMTDGDSEDEQQWGADSSCLEKKQN